MPLRGYHPAGHLVELARAHEVPLPSYDLDELFGYDNIVDFLTVFEAANQVFVDQGVFERVADESIEDAVAPGTCAIASTS